MLLVRHVIPTGACPSRREGRAKWRNLLFPFAYELHFFFGKYFFSTTATTT